MGAQYSNIGKTSSLQACTFKWVGQVLRFLCKNPKARFALLQIAIRDVCFS